MPAEKTEVSSQETLIYAIVRISILIQDFVTSLAIKEAHNEVERTDSLLQTIAEGLVDNILDKKLTLVKFESPFSQKTEETTTWRPPAEKMTQAML